MQNKGAIWLFTILLALACLFQISFSFVASSFESKAEDYAAVKVDSVAATTDSLTPLEESLLLDKFQTEYLTANSNEEIYPVLGYTYNEVKEKQIKLGLDLAGGMSVTLEVSIPDLIINLSNNARNDKLQKAIARAREMQKNSQDDFVTLFGNAWNELYPNEKMAAVFYGRENKDRFPRDASNEEILNILRDEARVAINNTEKILRTRIDKFGVAQPTIQKQQFSGRILVELPGIKDKERVRKQLKSTANLEFWNTYDNSEIIGYLDQANTALSEEMYPNLNDSAANSSEEDLLIEPEPDADTLTDATATEPDGTLTDDVASDTATGDDLLNMNSDTVADNDSLQDENLAREEQLKRIPLFSKLMPAIDNQTGTPVRGPIVGYASIADTAAVNKMLKSRTVQDLLPKDLRLLWAAETSAAMNQLLPLYAIKVDTRDGKAPLDGSVIVDASQEYDQSGQVQVSMTMNSDGARIWRNLTAEAAADNNRSIAIVLDNYVYSAPYVQSEIPTGRSSISMGTGDRNEQIEEALDLANLLKAGALPAPANIVNESVVGPSLGAENISDGLLSFAIALSVVFVYMILYYKGAGLVSDIALIANLFFLIGALASLKAALTLPGIAGIVLTIGMAVDANVIIFERIREELRAGKGIKLALKEGYQKAYSAIIDGNLTTLLTGFVLLILGSGPIKGFATTLIIGIFTSLFSAIFITRLILDERLQKGKGLSFAMKWSESILVNARFGFISKRKIAYIGSGLFILIGIISLSTRGLNFGVDFTGGRTYTVRFDKPAELDDIRNSLSSAFIDENGNKLHPEVKTLGADNQVKVTTKYLVNSTEENADAQVEAALRSGLDQLGDPYTIMESRKVDPSISDDFQRSSSTAVFFALIIIFLYILFRFRKWQYGLGASIALIHDVLVIISIYSLLYGLLPFSLEIDEAFIAAILTVVGYSINDTVIVFDRIREYIAEHTKTPLPKVVDQAINSTLTRTLNTAMTTFLVLLSMFIFGGESIRGFVFALLLGVVIGTYSSIYIASPIVLDFQKRTTKKELKA